MGIVPNLTLNDGLKIPQLGFGTYEIKPDETAQACSEALEVGYRHIDTAQMYKNERGVGEAFRASGLNRDEVFITTKLDNGAHERSAALEAFDRSLDALGMDHVDLFLIHWPRPAEGDFVDTWQALEEIHASGRSRSIGVSNFEPAHLKRILDAGLTVPAVNQVEVHPYLIQDRVRGFNAEHGIATEAWAPIAKGQILDDPTITSLAGRTDRTPAQVTLRWHLQRGDIIFPKSVHPGRMSENFDVFDFELSDEDMDSVSGLDRDGRIGPHPDRFT